MDNQKLIPLTTQAIPLSKIKQNTGQIPGLPGNPRKVSPIKLQQLVQSIREYPEMVSLREVMVYPYKGNYIVIGGNMRLRALKNIGYEDIPCKVIPETATVEQLKAYTLRDNAHYGEWDFDKDALASFGRVNIEELSIECPGIDFRPSVQRAAWHGAPTVQDARGTSETKTYNEPRCNMVEKPTAFVCREFSFWCSFKQTAEGIPLSEIKRDANNVDIFAQGAYRLLKQQLQLKNTQDWAIVTTPSRRHKEGNFAEAVCTRLSEYTQIPFLQGCVRAENKRRLEPRFAPIRDIQQNNIILYDDILTTGSTIRAMLTLLHNKNVVVIIGINNN